MNSTHQEDNIVVTDTHEGDSLPDDLPPSREGVAGEDDGDNRRRGRRRGFMRRQGAPRTASRRRRTENGDGAEAGTTAGEAEGAPRSDAPASRRSAAVQTAGAGQALPVDEDAVPFFAREAAIGLRAGAGRGGRRSAAPAAEAEKLHKILADAGIGSRRDMEELIISGRVSVNGKPAHVGQRVGASDVIRVNGKPLPRKRVATAAVPQVLLYHKPTGELVTRDDPEERPKVFDRLPKLRGARWIAVGRLDLNSEGLLIFTTSGDLANRLMHPRYGWEREYAVRVLGRVDDEARQRLLTGVSLDDGPAMLQSIEDIGGDGANHWYRVVILEGRNREVRRLFEAVGLTVSRLVRIRFGPVALPPRLVRGRFQALTEDEVRQLQQQVRKNVGTPAPAEAGTAASRPAGRGRAAGASPGGARHPTRRRLLRGASRAAAAGDEGLSDDGQAITPAGEVSEQPQAPKRGRGTPRRKAAEGGDAASARAPRRRGGTRRAADGAAGAEGAAPKKRATARRVRADERGSAAEVEAPRMVSVKVLEPTAEKRTLTVSERRGWTETRYLPQAVSYSGDTDWSKVARESVLPDRRPRRTKPRERNGNVAPRTRVAQPARRVNYEDDNWQPTSDTAHMEGITRSMRRDGRQERYGATPGFAAKLGQPWDPNAGSGRQWPAQSRAGNRSEREGRGKRSVASTAGSGGAARPRRRAAAKPR